MLVKVKLLSHVWLFATAWTVECQASLSFTISWSLLKLMSIKLVMPSNHLILCHPLLLHLQSSVSFQMSQFFTSGGQSIGASASTGVLPMNIQDQFPLGLSGLISLQSKGLSRVFPNTIDQKHQFFGTQPSLEKEMATHSSVLAWRIPGTGEPGGLPSMGSHRVRNDWSDLAAATAAAGFPGKKGIKSWYLYEGMRNWCFSVSNGSVWTEKIIFFVYKTIS